MERLPITQRIAGHGPLVRLIGTPLSQPAVGRLESHLLAWPSIDPSTLWPTTLSAEAHSPPVGGTGHLPSRSGRQPPPRSGPAPEDKALLLTTLSPRLEAIA